VLLLMVISIWLLINGCARKRLQVQNHNGEWIDAIEPDELVFNVGDMLSRQYNNKLKSTIHQVVNPPRELWGTSSYSVPFYASGEWHAIDCLKTVLMQKIQKNLKILLQVTIYMNV
jgi:isopenicillin N synthase-like dioxygenase